MTVRTVRTTGRQTAISASAPSRPRLRLQPNGSRRTLLDGGWWPRSTDPVAELPGLILAIDPLRGPVTRLVLSADGWDDHPRRLGVADRVLRLGYFTSQSTALLTAVCGNGDRVDLLVVAPNTEPGVAGAAMVLAATTANRVHAQHILATAGSARGLELDRGPEDTWETDGGRPRAADDPAERQAPRAPDPTPTAGPIHDTREGQHGQQDRAQGAPEEAGTQPEGKARREKGQERHQIGAAHPSDRPLT